MTEEALVCAHGEHEQCAIARLRRSFRDHRVNAFAFSKMS
jgi:hypothetical protein